MYFDQSMMLSTSIEQVNRFSENLDLGEVLFKRGFECGPIPNAQDELGEDVEGEEGH